MSQRIAAIDIGTVTTRLLIADITEKTIKHLVRSTAFTHLGEGLVQTGAINDAARGRLFEAIEKFRVKIAASQPDHLVVNATSAMRDATNSAEIVASLAAEGIDVQIIDGQTEAELSFKGVIGGFDTTDLPQKLPVIVVDVGGGSTELIIGTVDEASGAAQIVRSQSFDIGARRVTEMYFPNDPITDRQLEDCRTWSIAQFKGWLDRSKVRPAMAFIIGGAASTAASLVYALADYDSAKVHGTGLSIDTLEGLVAHLAELPLAQRQDVVGLERGRAGVIVGGLLTIVSALRATGMSNCIISETGILDGMVRAKFEQSPAQL